jgi:hypothetical protein
VALEKRLVHGHVLDGDHALPALELNNAVDQEKGVAVGQEIHDFLDGQRHSAAPREQFFWLLGARWDYK